MRTTSDPKPNNLKVRLNDDDFSYLKRKSDSNAESMSDHVRRMIRKEREEEIKSLRNKAISEN